MGILNRSLSGATSLIMIIPGYAVVPFVPSSFVAWTNEDQARNKSSDLRIFAAGTLNRVGKFNARFPFSNRNVAAF